MRFWGKSKITSVVAIAALAFGVSVPPATALEANTTVHGVIYTLDGAGAAYVSGYNNNRPAYLTIESSVVIGGVEYAVKRIGDFALAYGNLVSVSIPESVTEVGAWAFANDNALVSVNLPNVLTNIGDHAFVNASSLVSVTIPDSVSSIGDYAFANDTSLVSVRLPSSLTRLNDGMFDYATSLTSVFIPEGVTTIGKHAFHYATSLVSITIPDAVRSIGDYAFSRTTSLVSLTLPKSLETIGDFSFDGATSLKSIVFPKTLTSIGAFAFYSAPSLESATFQGPAPTVGYMAFYFASPTVYFYSRFRADDYVSGFTFPTWRQLNTVPVDEPLSLTPTPTITGIARFGETLTAVPGTWDPGVNLSYQWKRGGSSITNATLGSYSLTATDVGSVITVAVTGTKTG